MQKKEYDSKERGVSNFRSAEREGKIKTESKSILDLESKRSLAHTAKV